jgi:NAD(P)-dependent dehydrogenase (short-subunit alcohol dehydrogenase family)
VQIASGGTPEGTRLAAFVADMAVPAEIKAFAEHVAGELGTDSINLLFNNAGIGGGGSIVVGVQSELDRAFGMIGEDARAPTRR